MFVLFSWWRFQMESFSALLTVCEGNPLVTDGFSSQTPVTWSFDIFFDLRLNKRFSKRSRRRWFETPLRSLWCHCNVWPPRIICTARTQINKIPWLLSKLSIHHKRRPQKKSFSASYILIISLLFLQAKCVMVWFGFNLCILTISL